MNQTLEEMSQAMFKHQFIDGIDKDNLPDGWRMGKLVDIYKTTSGGTPSRSVEEYYIDGTIPWVKSKELNGGFVTITEEVITQSALRNSSAKLLPVHSVLVPMYGATVGKCILCVAFNSTFGSVPMRLQNRYSCEHPFSFTCNCNT